MCFIMPRDACCWRRRARTEPESPVYTKEPVIIAEDQEEEQKQQETQDDSPKENEPDPEGNPRNKCALAPGHSLMDWIRLGQSGRDLTGLGRHGGTLNVSPKQLAEHTSPEDAWLAIRGKVYNVTAYLPFHPGGKDELMKGVGKDATEMFNEVHAWVNYESILQKCLVGRLTCLEPDVNTSDLFYGTVLPGATSPASATTATTSIGVASKSSVTNGSPETSASKPLCECPKFDWIQRLDYMTTIFYTKPFSNPQVQITAPTKQNQVTISFVYMSHLFTNVITFSHNLHWPCRVCINIETGKVEIIFRKIDSKIWDNYGTMTQRSEPAPSAEENCSQRIKYIVMNKTEISHNASGLALQRADGVKQIVPLGRHICIHGTWNDQAITRSYTPVPSSYLMPVTSETTTTNSNPFRNPLATDDAHAGDVCILVKSYPTGMLSPWICSKTKGDTIELTSPLGNFELSVFQKIEGVLMLAAGTGITPMLGIIGFLLERRWKRCHKISLLFFNRTEKDILCREHLDKLHKRDKRFSVQHILSEPSSSWSGPKGHITASLLQRTVEDLVRDTHFPAVDVFSCVCGPTVFTNLARSFLTNMGYKKEKMHCFQG